MIVSTNDGRKAEILNFDLSESDFLLDYLLGLSEESKSRFGPHPFTADGISGAYLPAGGVIGYIAKDMFSGNIIAYALLKNGFLEHDAFRYSGYRCIPQSAVVCTFAPSVHDAWQGTGLGSRMLGEILKDNQQKKFRYMVLWGGVQASNSRALAFYQRWGFRVAGEFVHNGSNLDMYLPLPEH